MKKENVAIYSEGTLHKDLRLVLHFKDKRKEIVGFFDQTETELKDKNMWNFKSIQNTTKNILIKGEELKTIMEFYQGTIKLNEL
jgi:hypothetical protein